MTLMVDNKIIAAWNPETPTNVYHHIEKTNKPPNCDPYWVTRCGVGRNFLPPWKLVPVDATGYLKCCDRCKASHNEPGNDRHRLHLLRSIDEIPDKRITRGGVVEEGMEGSYFGDCEVSRGDDHD